MTEPTIRLAYSRNKHGFTCYSFEFWPGLSGRFPATKSGSHIVGADTLEEAKDIIMNRIRADWAQTERPFPEIIDCGKISEIRGLNHSF